MKDMSPVAEATVSLQPAVASSEWDCIPSQAGVYRWLPTSTGRHCWRPSDLSARLSWSSPKAILAPEHPVGYLHSGFFFFPIKPASGSSSDQSSFSSDEGPKTLHSREWLGVKEWTCLGSLHKKTFILFWSRGISLKDWLGFKSCLLEITHVCLEGLMSILCGGGEGGGNTQLKGAGSQGSKFSFSWQS